MTGWWSPSNQALGFQSNNIIEQVYDELKQTLRTIESGEEKKESPDAKE